MPRKAIAEAPRDSLNMAHCRYSRPRRYTNCTTLLAFLCRTRYTWPARIARSHQPGKDVTLHLPHGRMRVAGRRTAPAEPVQPNLAHTREVCNCTCRGVAACRLRVAVGHRAPGLERGVEARAVGALHAAQRLALRLLAHNLPVFVACPPRT